MSEASDESGERLYEAIIQSLPGRILPTRYRIDRLLSSSRFMAIYNCFFEPAEKVVNIRVFRMRVRDEEDYQFLRFKQEVKRLMSVNHPNVASVLDCGLLEEGLPYVVFDNIDGPSLEDVLKSQDRLEPDQVEIVFSQVARAVEEAHQRGVSHEALKPSRIIFSEMKGGEPLVVTTGFGLVSMMTKLGLSVKLPEARQDLIGSAAYMSPEQCKEDADIDGRSDIYAIGCMMYECLSGQKPFNAYDSSVLKMHVEREPLPIRALRRDLQFPRGLAGIVGKCMRKDPTMRYQFARDLESDLLNHVDPDLRDATLVMPKGMEKAQGLLREKKERLREIFLLLAGGVVVFVAVLLGAAYLVSVTSSFAGGAIWKGKLDAGIKAVSEGRPRDAEEALEEALAEAQKFGKSDLRRAITENELGEICLFNGQYGRAEDLALHALESEKSGTADDKIAHSKSCRLLSAAELALGKVSDAVANAKMAVSLSEESSANDVGLLCEAYEQLVKSFLAADDLSSARQVLDKLKESASKSSASSAEILSGAEQSEALFNQHEKNYEAAEKRLNTVLGIRQEKNGTNSLPALETMILLGKLYAEEGKFDKALKFLEIAYEAKSSLLGESSPAVVEMTFLLAGIYEKSKNLPQAEKFFRLAGEMAEKAYGKGSDATLPYLDALAAYLRAAGNIQSAEVYELEAREIRHPELKPKIGR